MIARMNGTCVLCVGTEREKPIIARKSEIVPHPNQTNKWVHAECVHEVCDACKGSKQYIVGPIINGVPAWSGPCFRCNSKGYQTAADKKRNWGYDNFYHRGLRD